MGEREREGEREGEVNRVPERRAADVWAEISFITSIFTGFSGEFHDAIGLSC